ncbi:MAG: glycosyltransferase family 39 protein [Acidobacteria bacterium]|nr:glycosyltransferase family 39 protein [Acidobacteriota bacterium]
MKGLKPSWLLALGLLSLLPGLGLKDPWPADEPRFVLLAEEMLASGNWLIPSRAGELYPDKPPVFMWLEAATLGATGSIRLAHQLPSLLAAILVLLLTFDLGRRLWNRRVGLWAAGVLMVTVQFVLQSRSGQIDGTLCLFTTLGLYGLLRHALLGPAWGFYFLGFAAMGVGVMTKGVGILPALALIPIALAGARGWKGSIPPHGGRWWLGPLVMLGVLALWAVPLWLYVQHSGDPDLLAYRDNLFFRQTVERYAQSWGHLKPPWYYLVSVIPWAWLPVSLALPWLIPAWRRRLARRDARYLVLLGWVVLVVVFFSLSSGKRGVYLLPATPALALAVAPLAPGLWRRRSLNRAGFALAALLAAAFSFGTFQTEKLAEQGMPPLSAPLAVAALLAVASLVVARPRKGLVALLGTLVAVWVVLGLWVVPKIDPYRSGRQLMLDLEEAMPPEGEVMIVQWREQMILHAARTVVHFGYHPPGEEQARWAASWLAQAPAGSRVLVPERFLSPCFEPSGEVLGTFHRRDWYLAGPQALTGACTGETAPRTFRYDRAFGRRSGRK